MTRFFLPLILIIASIGLFVLYISPTYQGMKGLQVKQDNLNGALDKAKELRALREDLVKRRNTFSPDDIKKLEKTLPDNVDNIRLIIDINNIASRHGLPISNLRLGEVSDSASTRSAAAVGSSGDAVGSVTLSFSVTASYDTLNAFLQDLEHSQRLLTVERIAFKSTLNDRNTYDISLRTYWMH